MDWSFVSPAQTRTMRPESPLDYTWRQGLWGGGAGYMRSWRWVSNPTGLVPFKRRRHQQTSTLGSQSPREATQRPGSWLQARVRAFTRTSINRQLALRLPASSGVENKLLMPPSLQHFVMAALAHWYTPNITNSVKLWSFTSEVKSLSHAQLFATPWTVAYQAPPSMGFSRQESWSGLPFPSPDHSLETFKLLMFTTARVYPFKNLPLFLGIYPVL